MKIGQITWWRNNYGSILQAYALQKQLIDLGADDCEIICQYGKKVTSFNNLKDKLKNTGFKNTIKKILGKYTLSGIRARTKNMEKFVNDNLKISELEYNESNITTTNDIYDAFVCGSDQIWNPSLTKTDSFYWLNFVDDSKIKISYAPSVGVNEFSDIDKKNIQENLKTFKGISCREESGTNAINNALGCEKCVTVLDPTLIVDKKNWDILSENRLIKEKYIFTYLLRGTKEQRKSIEKFAKEHKLLVVTIPLLEPDNVNIYDFKFGNIKVWDASPSDFISLIRYAEYVFTDSFHSMIFSTIYHKEFFTFPKIGSNQQNRILNFQKSLLQCDRMISNYKELSEEIKKVAKLDWKKIDKNISTHREKSVEFLKKSLFK